MIGKRVAHGRTIGDTPQAIDEQTRDMACAPRSPCGDAWPEPKKAVRRDPARGEWMTAEAAGIYLNYSKNRVSEETLKLLVELAEQSGLRARIST